MWVSTDKVVGRSPAGKGQSSKLQGQRDKNRDKIMVRPHLCGPVSARVAANRKSDKKRQIKAHS